MGISRDSSDTDFYQPLTSVHFDQKRKPEGKMRVLYINLYVAMVMVAYTLANPVKTRSSSGADQNLEEEYLVPVKREDKFVKSPRSSTGTTSNETSLVGAQARSEAQ